MRELIATDMHQNGKQIVDDLHRLLGSRTPPIGAKLFEAAEYALAIECA